MGVDARQLQDQRKAALLFKWSDFFKWLTSSFGLHLSNTDPGKPQHCPVHGGDSGEAFRFFSDFHLTGGGICNSGCIKMSSGDKLVTGWLSKLREANGEAFNNIANHAGAQGKDPEALTAALIDLFLSENQIDLPPPRVGLQVARWISGIDVRIALKYLATRGLRFSPNDLPSSIRGSKRYWAHPNYKKATGLLGLVFSNDDKPVTHQVIFTNKQGEKLGTRTEDNEVLELMRDGKPKKPPVKRLASLEQQEDLSFRYVPLGDNSAETLLLGEGIETVLAGRRIYEHIHKSTPAARAMVGSPYMNQVIPEHITQVFALIDNDHTIERAQEELEFLATEYPDKKFWMLIPKKWSKSELTETEVNTTIIPESGKDWLDTYVRFSEEECGAIWKEGAKRVKATGISRFDIGATASTSTKNSSQGASSPWEPGSGLISVNVPISDNKFFSNLSRALKRLGMNWMRDEKSQGVFCFAGNNYIPLSDESMIAEIAQGMVFYPDNGGSYRNSSKKEIAFPEDRVRRWTKTSGFKKTLSEVLKPVHQITPCLNLEFERSRWTLSTKQKGRTHGGRYVLTSELHKAAYSRAKDWIEMCEGNSELVLIDVGLINQELANHIRTSGIINNPAALTRVTTILMCDEVLERFIKTADEKVNLPLFYDSFFRLVTGKCIPSESSTTIMLGSLVDSIVYDCPKGMLSGLPLSSKAYEFLNSEKEAVLGILYLAVLGWERYSASASEEGIDVSDAIYRWCGLNERLSDNKSNETELSHAAGQ